VTPLGSATAVYVVYRTTHLDLSWLPHGIPVVIVHNDRVLDPSSIRRDHVDHVFTGENVGFGAGVNRALARVGTAQVVICNPDTEVAPDHWRALTSGGPDDVVTVPIADPEGRATSVVNRYPTPVSLVLTGYRAGRLAPVGGRARSLLARTLGHWGREHAMLRDSTGGSWPITTHWASGALVAFPTERLRQIGGFDERYFLYLEDVDLCRRLAQRFPTMRIVMAPTEPARHQVGGSAPTTAARRAVNRHYFASVQTYTRDLPGWRWRLASALLTPRAALLNLR
jgi:N-acetylglucosaminyl-diphospho-decaprenol L-rhamnosyltransferase